MKLLPAGLILTGLMACAQKKDIPKVVTDAFTNKFPTAKSVKRDKETEIEWEAEFKMNGTEYSANFESNGTWKETEHEIEMSEVPKNLMDTPMSTLTDYKVKESEISETEDGLLYEFEIKKGKTIQEIAIDVHGTIIKKTELGEDKNDNHDND